MKYETIKNVLCDFCEPDNWETSEQYHRYGSYTQYLWDGDKNPMTVAENALDELDTLVGEIELLEEENKRLSAIVKRAHALAVSATWLTVNHDDTREYASMRDARKAIEEIANITSPHFPRIETEDTQCKN